MARYARAAPKGSLLRRAIVKMLLSVLAGSSAAPQVPILPGQETKSHCYARTHKGNTKTLAKGKDYWWMIVG